MMIPKVTKLALTVAASLTLAAQLAFSMEVLVLVGLEGEDEYREVFQKSADHWRTACDTAGVDCTVLGDLEEGASSSADIRSEIQGRLAEPRGDGESLWLILLGHGSFDGREAKFNIAGGDFTARELGEWCKGIESELVVVNTTASSAPFMRALAGPGRTIITATKSANEIYFARFGTYFSEAITGISEADLDNDDQVSLLEAFLYASAEVAIFYEEQERLVTEHALIDDNGDALGTRAEWFEGTTATRTAKDGAEPDGLRAMQQVLVKNEFEKRLTPEQRTRRDELEREVRLLRRNKENTDEAEYYGKLENLLRELGGIYQSVEAVEVEVEVEVE